MLFVSKLILRIIEIHRVKIQTNKLNVLAYFQYLQSSVSNPIYASFTILTLYIKTSDKKVMDMPKYSITSMTLLLC